MTVGGLHGGRRGARGVEALGAALSVGGDCCEQSDDEKQSETQGRAIPPIATVKLSR